MQHGSNYEAHATGVYGAVSEYASHPRALVVTQQFRPSAR